MLLRRCLLTSFCFIVAGPLTLANPDAKLDSADPWRVRLETTATNDIHRVGRALQDDRSGLHLSFVGGCRLQSDAPRVR